MTKTASQLLRPLYRAGCCIQCGRAVKHFHKLDPLYYTNAGPVYIHAKCVEPYETESGPSPFYLNPNEPKEDTDEKA